MEKREGVAKNRTLWTNEKIEELRALYLNNSAPECARLMNMSLPQIKNAISRFGLFNENATKRMLRLKDIGHEHIDRRGDVIMKTENGWVYKARFVWVQHNGAIGRNDIVRFKDNDKTNCDINNLYLVPRSNLAKENSFNRYPNDLRNVINLTNKFKREIKKYE